jgi:hypothetical protein
MLLKFLYGIYYFIEFGGYDNVSASIIYNYDKPAAILHLKLDIFSITFYIVQVIEYFQHHLIF